MSTTNTKGKGYNYSVKQLTTAERTTTASGTKQIKFRGSLKLRGKDAERTIVAQGKSAELIEGMLRKGNTLDLRVVFNRAPANEDGSKGGEFLSVIDLPRKKEQKAA